MFSNIFQKITKKSSSCGLNFLHLPGNCGSLNLSLIYLVSLPVNLTSANPNSDPSFHVFRMGNCHPKNMKPTRLDFLSFYFLESDLYDH